MASSRFPCFNTVSNTQGGTTSKIGNMMIITGYISNASSGGHQVIFPENFLYPPVVTFNTSPTSYDTPVWNVFGNKNNSTVTRSGVYINIVYGGNYFGGSGTWQIMYTAIGMI